MRLNGWEVLGAVASLLAIVHSAIAFTRWVQRRSKADATRRLFKDQLWGVSLALIASLIWSVSYTSLSIAAVGARPLEINVVLLGVASVAYLLATVASRWLAPWLTREPKESEADQNPPGRVAWRTWAPWLVVLGNIGSFILFVYALYSVSASQAITLQKTNPIFVAVLGAVLLRQRISYSAWLALGLVVVGTTLTVADLSGEAFRLRTGSDILGSLFALGAGASFALLSIGLDEMKPQLIHLYTRLSFMTRVFLLSYVAVLTLAYLSQEAPLLDAKSLGILVANGIRVAVVYLIYLAAIRRIGALLTAVFVSFEVFLTMLWDHVLLQRAPAATLWLGAIIIVAGGLTLLMQQASVALDGEEA